jgi:hypothetical protein
MTSGRPGPDRDDGAPAAAELDELTAAASALRRRITSPELYPHPFPQEYTLLAVARVLESIANAGPTPDVDQWARVVDAGLEIARHVHHSGPVDADPG